MSPQPAGEPFESAFGDADLETVFGSASGAAGGRGRRGHSLGSVTKPANSHPAESADQLTEHCS